MSALEPPTQHAERDWAAPCRAIAEDARRAARRLAVARGETRDAWLRAVADRLRQRTADIVDANALDLDDARQRGLSPAMIDRLALDNPRVEAIARAVDEIAALPDPLGEVVRSARRPNGLEVRQERVPIGVLFMIYESRPNVTVDAAAICVKSGNAVILRGGSEARHSNLALHRILVEALHEVGLPTAAVQAAPTSDRAAVGEFLKLEGLVDLVIPRGGESLIRRVVAESRIPVLKHYNGNCHVFVDASADPQPALRVVLNAKVQRPGVCNAMETLLVHRDIAPAFLPEAARALREAGVELRGNPEARAIVPDMIPATPGDWDAEYLDKILAVAVLPDLDAAIEHVNRHGSGHTDAILTRDLHAARRFVAEVDSAAVMVNASTRFNDGGQLGLGAEIGISTDKLHARGPCGLRELTTTKWIVIGDMHIRQ